MNTDLIFVFDVDGVSNILGDAPFLRTDIEHKMLKEGGRPIVELTFSPQVARDIGSIAQKHSVIWGTCWNSRTKLMVQAGFPELPFLDIIVDEEKASKISHISHLARDHKVIWVDDFAQEWITEVNPSLRENIIVLQPDHREGISQQEMEFLKSF